VSSRGGPQHIPRPESARPGRPPPWSHIPEAQRQVSLENLTDLLTNRRPRETVGPPPDDQRRESAVLAALYETENEVEVILTRRSEQMRSHSLEVSFPGGARDTTDESLWNTALRESEEEIGLDPGRVSKIGELDRFVTVGSRSLVHPYVGVLPSRPDDLVAAPAEVANILHVPLSELLLDEVFREDIWQFGDRERPITFFELHGDTVWGATAAMLRQLLAIATGSNPELTR
jgi:8-oxo-dGTP pyrophosphatase MutT (NUDIX family)